MQEHGVEMLSLVEKLEDLKAGLDNVTKRLRRLRRKARGLDPGRGGRVRQKRQLSSQQKALRALPLLHREWARERGRWVLNSNRGQTITAPITMRKGIGRGIIPDSPKQGMFLVEVLQRSRKLRKDEVVLRLGDGKPLNTQARGRFSYFITFTDDCSRYGYVYLMRYKFAAFVRSARVPQPPERYGFLGVISQLDNDPKTYREVISDIDSEKIGADGEVRTFKASLVAKGYTQQRGVGFEETFSPIAMAKSIWSILAIAACKFPEAGTYVLMKSYGAMISSRTTDPCVYRKDFGKASYILGIKIFRDRSKRILGMTQNSYLEKVLKRFKIEHSKRGFLSMRHRVKLFRKQSPKTDEDLKRMLDVPYTSASSKKDTVPNSTTEAEYIAASEVAKEAVSMKNYIQLGVVISIAKPVVIFCDTNEAIAQAKEPRSHHQSKHILRRYNLLKEMVGRGDARMD
ncbi:UNVERIFIED_CONTAM: Retrovirus-related Pol polyprotein from transposon TNT 1-94 [Sesamum calycinum]|uniref:Retrovirus-related Pol polyprotein from transposon TNT 1-94 n=1 Tax=Sesamum calycinum TaxID=2727403 RepID=A0AAW2JEL4_9LAMI